MTLKQQLKGEKWDKKLKNVSVLGWATLFSCPVLGRFLVSFLQGMEKAQHGCFLMSGAEFLFKGSVLKVFDSALHRLTQTGFCPNNLAAFFRRCIGRHQDDQSVMAVWRTSRRRRRVTVFLAFWKRRRTRSTTKSPRKTEKELRMCNLGRECVCYWVREAWHYVKVSFVLFVSLCLQEWLRKRSVYGISLLL